MFLTLSSLLVLLSRCGIHTLLSAYELTNNTNYYHKQNKTKQIGASLPDELERSNSSPGPDLAHRKPAFRIPALSVPLFKLEAGQSGLVEHVERALDLGGLHVPGK